MVCLATSIVLGATWVSDIRLLAAHANAQLPVKYRRKILVRVDGAGAPTTSSNICSC
jgi:hypothetical protein